MRYLSKASSTIAIIAAVVATASAADARSYRAYDGAYNATGAYERSGSSVPYDAGGVAYSRGQRGQDRSSDFQLQGR